MVKKFNIDCLAGREKLSLEFYVGNPHDNSHPIGFQMKFLGQKGITVPENIVKSLESLHQIAKKNAIPFEDLLSYVNDQMNLEEVMVNSLAEINKFNIGNSEK